MGPLLPRLRGHFAEFLGESSLARLSALTLAHLCRLSVRALPLHRLEVFLGTLESTSYQPRRVFPSTLTLVGGGFASPPRLEVPAGLYHGSGWPILMRHPITPWERGRSIHLQSIDYANWPRLRSRLTLRGRPLLRKPWAFGGRDSHPSYRYSFLHSHFRCLHTPSRVVLQQPTERSPTPGRNGVPSKPRFRYVT